MARRLGEGIAMLKARGLEYETAGEGEAVLLIHGALVAGTFLPLMKEPALAERHRLIRYHRRGHAGSDPVSGKAGFEQQARDARALLAHLGVERAHVVGHSGGGATAVQLALEATELVHSLVLLEPAIMPPAALPTFIEGTAPVLAAHRSGDVAKALDLWMGAVSASDWRSVVESRVPGGVEQAERDAATFFDAEFPTLADWRFDAEQAARISQPILYAIGSESGPLFEMAWQHFRSLVPHAEKVVVPGVNHLMQAVDPKGVAAPIAEFLARHPI
jgi:pimeloyl-ACP methyl ester carboxylesterase